jgi:uncharacterized membrane protein YgdD (TMEM256/DUF423 family)
VNPATRLHNPAKRALFSGALLMALATVIGAIGTHRLKAVLSADSYGVLQTAVMYQFLHALGLLCIGILLQRRVDRVLGIASDLLLAGVLLFSGSLYALLCGAPRAFGMLTPLGGLCLIVGWCVAAAAVLRTRETPVT